MSVIEYAVNLMEHTMDFVCGFAIMPNPDWVFLVRKTHGPSSVVGKLNGIGGKIDDGESPLQAMRREFREETTFDIEEKDWDLGVVLQGRGWSVYFYTTTMEAGTTFPCENDAGEEMNKYPLKNLSRLGVVENLRWILPLCMDSNVLPNTVQDIS